MDIQDRRPRGWFWIDNELLDNFGKVLGPYGLAIYMALARFADQGGNSFPSYATLAERTGMGRREVMRRIKQLEDLGLLTVVEQSRELPDGKKQMLTNIYTLIRVPHGG